MRLSNCFLSKKSVAHETVPRSLYTVKLVFTVFRFGLVFLQYGLFLVPVAAALPDIPSSHLLPPSGPIPENRVPIYGDAHARFKRDAFGSTFSGENERGKRSRKEFFRVELLRQIKAIDHMKCFPKVLCGLSVDTDKSFGINKSNFVKSYLELMRNIKPPQEGAEERLKTEDEVEGELLWRFSPHNPDRKHHSSFERISSAAMSGSDELGDSPEDVSRGLDSRVIGDSSMSMEKDDRMGIAVSVESKEELSSTKNKPSTQDTKTDNSKIPGEKKKTNSNKSLTAKLTSYFTSWLPEVSFVKDRKEDSVSKDVDSEDMKRTGKSMNDEDHVGINSNWPLSTDDFLAHLPELLKRYPVKRAGRQGKADDAASTDSDDDDGVVREDAEHEADIYHTAVNIGKRLKDPKQCDYIYNGCPLEYNKIIHMISDIRTDIDPPDDQAVDALSQEFGLEEEAPPPTTSTTTTTTTTTTSTTTTTTKRPQRKKNRPSTKIMHVLPNGEKVEINFRLGGSEDSDESSSSHYSTKKEYTEEQSSFEKANKGEGEVVVVDLGQRAELSTEEDFSSERAILSSRKGAPVDAVVVKNKSHKRKNGHSNQKKNILSDLKTEGIEQSGELSTEQVYRQDISNPSPPSIITAASYIRNKPSPIKLSGLTLQTNNNDEQQLELSPSYVIFKHQPLTVHAGLLDGLPSSQTQPQVKPVEKLQTFQLIQNGQQIDADKITEYLKSFIRQNGGLIPKLTLHSSGLITTEPQDNFQNPQNSYILGTHLSDLMSTPQTQTTQTPQPQPSQYPPTTLNLNTGSSAMSKIPTTHYATTYKAPLPQSAFPLSYLTYHNQNVPEISGSVPGRFNTQAQKKKSPTTTTTTTTTSTPSTPSTTTENIILPGMAETLTLDTEEITDDTMDKLKSQDSDRASVPSWITPPPTSSLEIQRSRESEEEQTMLENLNKTYLNDNNKSKIRYKNPVKKRPPVKVNSSRVRNPSNKRKKGTKYGNNSESSSDESTERVVIKHAGPYSGSPTVYKSPLKGPGPHGGAYPYLPTYGMNPNVYPGYPSVWRM